MTLPSIRFRIDTRSPVVPYRQIVEQVRLAVDEGRLQQGDQLPSVRDVVGQVTINPNTVQRAYRELENLGFVEGRHGLGTFVVSSGRVRRRLGDGRLLATAMSELIAQAMLAGATSHELTRVFDECLNGSTEASLR
jgi:GntR family transcriptional regulator